MTESDEELRNSTSIAIRVLGTVQQLFKDQLPAESDSAGLFSQCAFLLANDYTGDRVVKEFIETPILSKTGNSLFIRIGPKLTSSLPAIAYSFQALEEPPSELDKAWRWASEANYWCGIAVGINCGEKASVSLRAKYAASKRHFETDAIKADAIQYYLDHKDKFKNKDLAAIYISSNIVPAAFSTVRDYLKGF